MNRLRNDTQADGGEVVPGWKSLLDRLEEKDERIAELEDRVRRLREELEALRPDEGEVGAPDGPTRAEILVAELRRTAENPG